MTQVLFTRADGNPVREELKLPPARSRRRLSTLMRLHADKSRPHLAYVVRSKDLVVPIVEHLKRRRNWEKTTLGNKDTLIIVYMPRGGGSGGKSGGASSKGKGASIGLLVATVALAAIGQFWAIGAIAGALGTTTAVASTIWAVGSTALLAGVGYFMSRALKPKANKTEDNRPVYGVSGGGNLPRAGDRIPVIYGRTWHTPDLSQPDYAIYDGDDQVLYKRLVIGCGKYSLKTIRVAGITMWTASGGLTGAFVGAEYDIIDPGTTSSLVPGSVASVQAVGSNVIPKADKFPPVAGPFNFGSSARPQTRIQLDYTVQASYAVVEGGSNQKYDGKQYPANWGVRFEYATCDLEGNITGPWNFLYADGAYVQTTRPIRKSVFIDIASGNYAFRAQNTGDPDQATHPSGGFSAKFTNPVVWEGLRSHYPETIVREGITELALKIRSGEALSVTAFGEVEVEVQRILPVWYGDLAGWIEEETSKCVWAMADILRDTRYGASIGDAEIDLTTLRYYHELLSKFDTFNAVIRGPVSVYEAMTTAMGTMRASPIRLGQAWSMIRDDQKQVRKHVITRRQILADSSNQVFTVDLSDGSADVIVEWFTDGDPKRMQTYRTTIGSTSLTPRRISLTGVRDAEHAIHMSKYAAATAYYRREKRTIGMEFAGRLVLPNDSALIDIWYFDSTQDAAVQYRLGSTFTLIVDKELTTVESQFAMFRARDGREWGPCAVEINGTQITLDAADVAQAESLSGLTLGEMLARPGQADTSVLIGDLTEVSEKYLVRSIAFNGDNVTIEALFDAPQVWTTLGEPIIIPPLPPSTGLETPEQAIIPFVRADPVQKNGAIIMEWTLGRGRNVATYVLQISYDNFVTWEEVNRGTVTSGSYPIREGAGTVFVRAYGLTPSGLKGPTVTAQFAYAPAVINLGNAVNGSLPIEAFTDEIQPVLLVDGLPVEAGYTGPPIVFNIQDEKQYRYADGQWKPVFDVGDIPNGSITETLIADDSISTPKLRANSVSTDKMVAGSVTTPILSADSVTAGKIAVGAVSANKINVVKLDAISADLGSILAGALNINNRFIVAANGTVTISSAASGARFVITGSAAFVYDASNVMRVRMGVW